MFFRRFTAVASLLVVAIALLFTVPTRAVADDTVAPHPGTYGVCLHQIGPGQAYGPAGGEFIDPINEICNISTGWIQPAKVMAMNLLVGLLVIEFTFVGIQTGLFKNDLSEFFGTVAFKVFVSCLMIWVITNADSFLYGIIEGFEYAGRNLSGVHGSEIGQVVGFFLTSGLMLANEAGALQSHDLDMAGSPFTSTPGGAAFAMVVSQQHNQHAAIIGFLGLVLLVSAGTILLQYFLITAESFIVIFGGIVFLGFAGSRFTLPFAQGYLSYAVNNGARFFAFYLVMSIEYKLVEQLTVGAAASIAHLDDIGFPAYPLLAQCSGLVMQVAILASLCWFIPNLAGSLMTGGAAFSAQSMMGNLSGMVAGIQSMMANNQAVKAAAADQQRMSGNAAALNEAHPMPQTGLASGDENMAPSSPGSLGQYSFAGGPESSSPAASGSASAATPGGSGTGSASSASAASASASTGAARPLNASAASASTPSLGGAAQAHESAPSSPSALASNQSLGGDGGSTGGTAPSADAENAAQQAGTSLGDLSKSQMGGVSAADAANAAVSGNLQGAKNLSGLQPAAVDSARQSLTSAEQDNAIKEDYDRAQESSAIRSASPTGETPTPAVQVRFGLGER